MKKNNILEKSDLKRGVKASDLQDERIVAKNKYESLYLFNEICQFEKQDKKSPRFSGHSILGMLSKLGFKDKEELLFEDKLIKQFFDVEDKPNGQIYSVEDLFYKKEKGSKIRLEDFEIRDSMKRIIETVDVYESSALKYTHISEHYSSLTLPEYLSIAKEKINELNLSKENSVVFDDEKLKESFSIIPEQKMKNKNIRSKKSLKQ